MIGVGLMPAFWNLGVILAQECFLWVDPPYRTGLGQKLVAEAEKHALAKGAVLSSMAAEHGLRGEAVGQLFRRKGYAPAETVFWKQLRAA
jgi:GNAT superfamily N-acetyltransferase